MSELSTSSKAVPNASRIKQPDITPTLETSFVGFRVNRHGIHTEEKKVRAVQDWPTHKTPTELCGFLGLAGYYRKFVPKFAHQTHLLHDLALKPKSEYVWTS